MFQYEFMRTAFIVGILLGIAIPILGQTMVFKRLSMSGDALAHTSLAGVALGLVCGLNPLAVAIVLAVISSLVVEFARKKFKKYNELIIAVVLAFAIALAGLLSSFTSSTNFSSYLFGSIVLVNNIELYLVIAIFILVVIFELVFYKKIFYITYSEIDAKIDGVQVNTINILHTILTAMVVAVASKTIGTLMVSALMVVPCAAALQVSKNYKQTLIYGIVFSVFSVIIGLTISYYCSLRPGAVIVLCSIVFLVLALSIKKIFKITN